MGYYFSEVYLLKPLKQNKLCYYDHLFWVTIQPISMDLHLIIKTDKQMFVGTIKLSQYSLYWPWTALYLSENRNSHLYIVYLYWPWTALYLSENRNSHLYIVYFTGPEQLYILGKTETVIYTLFTLLALNRSIS